MGAVDVGVGHDHDALVAQILGPALVARAAAQSLDQVGDLAVGADLVGGGGSDVQDLAAYRKDRLRLAVARLLGRAARAVALDDEDLGPRRIVVGAVGELARKPQLAPRGRRLALDLALGAARQPFVHPLEHEAEQSPPALHMVGEIMVEMVAHRGLDQPRRVGRGQPILGLALELRIADEERKHDLGAVGDVLGLDVPGLLLPDQLGEGAKPAGQRLAKPLLVGAPVGRRDRVAVEGGVALAPERPGHRPFDRAGPAREILPPGEGRRGRRLLALDLLAEVIGEAAGELEHRLVGNARLAVLLGEQGRVALPAYLDPGEEVSLGPREPVEPRRLEPRVGPENLRVGGKGDGGAATVLGGPHFDQLAGRNPAREALAVDHLAPGDLDHRVGRQRIDHRDPDAVKAARRGVGLVGELPARMERGHDHLERRLARIFGMLVDRHAAAVVGDRQPPGGAFGGLQRDLDPVGVPGHRLVHAVVEHLGGEMVKRPLVGPADIHARAAADGLQAFEHLDRVGVVIGAGAGGGSEQVVGHGRGMGRGNLEGKFEGLFYPQVDWVRAETRREGRRGAEKRKGVSREGAKARSRPASVQPWIAATMVKTRK